MLQATCVWVYRIINKQGVIWDKAIYRRKMRYGARKEYLPTHSIEAGGLLLLGVSIVDPSMKRVHLHMYANSIGCQKLCPVQKVPRLTEWVPTCMCVCGKKEVNSVE